MYKKEIVMHRTQIYFEDQTFNDLKQTALTLNISLSEFIRRTIKQELKKQKTKNINDFLNDMQDLESFNNTNSIEYVDAIRGNSRIIGG